jgi:hypothetical protein
MLKTENEPTPKEIFDLFKSSSKDDWIAGEEEDDAAFGHKQNLFVSLWRHPQGYELKYGYQTIAIVGEPGSGKIITIVDDTVVIV